MHSDIDGKYKQISEVPGLAAKSSFIWGPVFLKPDQQKEKALTVTVKGDAGAKFSAYAMVFTGAVDLGKGKVSVQDFGAIGTEESSITIPYSDLLNSIRIVGISNETTAGPFSFSYKMEFPKYCPLPGTTPGDTAGGADAEEECPTQCSDPNWDGPCFFTYNPPGQPELKQLGGGSGSYKTYDACVADPISILDPGLQECLRQNGGACDTAFYGWSDGSLGACRLSTTLPAPDPYADEWYETEPECDFRQDAAPSGQGITWTWLGDESGYGLCGVMPDPATGQISVKEGHPAKYLVSPDYCTYKYNAFKAQNNGQGWCQAQGYPAGCVDGPWFLIDTSADKGCPL
jgi:hypothetical protein